MNYLSLDKLKEIFGKIYQKKILIIGDIILDEYLKGEVNRISPEAPVPVVDIISHEKKLGGAANVANNVKELGGIPYLVGIIGHDSAGEACLELIKKNAFFHEGVIFDSDRPTTVKTRIIAHNQQVVRFDREVRTYINQQTRKKIYENVFSLIETADAVLFEDYNKGLLTQKLIREVIELSLKKKKPVTVDPKFNNFFSYKKVTLIKPNKSEVEKIFGIELIDALSLTDCFQKIHERLQCKAILITLGENGMTLFTEEDGLFAVKTVAREVFDVSGAGDTVISTLTLALACGATFREATIISNLAAGIEVGKSGVATVSKDEIIAKFNEEN